MNDSHITINHDGSISAYVGEDATRLFQAKVIRQGLKACKIGMRLTRNATPSHLFKMTGEFTGKTYKRGQYDQAIADLDLWISAMTCALPIHTH